MQHVFAPYSLCDSTYLLEHAVRLHLLTGVIRRLRACLTSCRCSWEARGLTTADKVTMLTQFTLAASLREVQSLFYRPLRLFVFCNFSLTPPEYRARNKLSARCTVSSLPSYCSLEAGEHCKRSFLVYTHTYGKCDQGIQKGLLLELCHQLDPIRNDLSSPNTPYMRRCELHYKKYVPC